MNTLASSGALEGASPVPPRAIAERYGRVELVDVLKLLALLQMVNGHTLDAVLDDTLRRGPIFDRYVYLRGLVSVAFMLCAGLAYHLTTYARFDAHLADRSGRWKRVRRGLWLIVLGYLLHWPFGAFSGDPARTERAIAALARVDVLQCIGVSLLLLEAINAVARDVTRARSLAAMSGVVLMVFAPLTDGIHVDASNRWWASWLTHDGGSLFPITPWAAYVLLGAALGGLVLPGPASRARREGPRRIALAAITLGAVSLAVALVPLPEGVARSAQPAFVLEKTAVVLSALAGIGWMVRNLPSLPAPLRVLAGETLVIYVFHLVALYWTRISPGRVLGHTLPLDRALGVSLVMIAASAGVGLAAPHVRGVFDRLVRRPERRT